jgi:uncharacterized membrane protein YhiD involved in acid resistance
MINMPEIDIIQAMIGLFFCVIASFILRFTYVSKSISLSGKLHLGTVIPLLSTITFLVILVVKSSLALSLGLVGALSIVRFRTPIKEPEELAYLFLAIGIGLGYGAGQIIITSLVFIVIIMLIILFLSRKNVKFENEFNLMVDCEDISMKIESIIGVLNQYATEIELSKFGKINEQASAFFRIKLKPDVNVDLIGKDLRNISRSIDYSFYENRVLQ